MWHPKFNKYSVSEHVHIPYGIACMAFHTVLHVLKTPREGETHATCPNECDSVVLPAEHGDKLREKHVNNIPHHSLGHLKYLPTVSV